MKNERALAVGDRVKDRKQPWVHGTVWSLETIARDGCVVVNWDNQDDNAFCHPSLLIRLHKTGTKKSGKKSGVRAAT